jgi:hypothetical protein
MAFAVIGRGLLWASATLGLMLSSASVTAQTQSKVDYAADWRMETAEGVQSGRVHHSAGLERREVNNGGEKVIVISRPDKKLMWSLMPSERMYMEMAIGEEKKSRDDVSQYDIEQTPAGEEMLNGLRTSKSKIIMKPKKPDGSKLGGFWWTTREGIVVKMDLLAIDQGSKERIKSELSNLQVGKQDPQLFEVPPGYEKMGGMGGMGGMLKMMGGGAGKDEDGDEDKSAKSGKDGKDGKKKDGLGLKDALKLFR